MPSSDALELSLPQRRGRTSYRSTVSCPPRRAADSCLALGRLATTSAGNFQIPGATTRTSMPQYRWKRRHNQRNTEKDYMKSNLLSQKIIPKTLARRSPTMRKNFLWILIIAIMATAGGPNRDWAPNRGRRCPPNCDWAPNRSSGAVGNHGWLPMVPWTSAPAKGDMSARSPGTSPGAGRWPGHRGGQGLHRGALGHGACLLPRCGPKGHDQVNPLIPRLTTRLRT